MANEEGVDRIRTLINQLVTSPDFQTIVAEAVSNFQTNQPINRSSTTPSTTSPNTGISGTPSTTTSRDSIVQPTPCITSAHAQPMLRGSPQQHQHPSIIQHLRALFPRTPTRRLPQSRRPGSTQVKCSKAYEFYKEVILLTSPNCCTTLKGSRKSDAYLKGFVKADVMFNKNWSKAEIVANILELFPVIARSASFEIMVPESGRLISIDESRGELNGSKLQRLFQNRKPVYIRPDQVLAGADAESGCDSDDHGENVFQDVMNVESSRLAVHSTDPQLSGRNNINSLNDLSEHTPCFEDISCEESDEVFQRNIQRAIEESIDQGKTPTSLKDVLEHLSGKISENQSNYFNILRTDVFHSFIRSTKRRHFDPFNRIDVIFTHLDETPEGAVDVGGPKREMFTLLLQELEHGPLFVGSTTDSKKFISYNCRSVENKEYFEAGRSIAMSITHTGLGPHFFSKTLYSLLVHGEEKTEPCVEFLENDIVEKIRKVEEFNQLSDLQEYVMNECILTVAGVDFVSKLSDKHKIVENALRFYSFHRVKVAVDQLADGLRTCGVLDMMKNHPHLFEPLMCDDTQKLTFVRMLNLFDVTLGESGSNRRIIEDRQLAFWRDYLLDCEDNEDGAQEDCCLLKEVLMFATGTDIIPSLGFIHKPSLHFLEDGTPFPKANTCGLELWLPLVHEKYEDFKYHITFGVKNGMVFGFS